MEEKFTEGNSKMNSEAVAKTDSNKKKSGETNMTEGNPMSLILKFTLPLFIGNVFQQFYNMVDSIIVGHFVNADALGAVGSTGTIMFLLLGFGTGLTQGYAVLPSQRFGAGDTEGVKRGVANSLVLSIITSILVTAVGVAVMNPLLHLMNTPDNIYDYAYKYIIVIAWGTATIVFYNLFSSLLRSVGNSTAPLFFLIFSAVLNIFLDLLFIAVFKMGTMGAALATDCAQGISAIFCGIYIWVKFPILRPRRKDFFINIPDTKKQLGVGLPMALQFSITASGAMVMQTAINAFGSTAISAFTAAGKLVNLLMQGFLSFGQADATYCAQNFGKGDYGRVKEGVKATFILTILYTIVAVILTFALLRVTMYLFFDASTDIDEMIMWARPYVVYASIFYFPLGMIFIYRNSMQGCGYGLLPMIGGIVEFCARTICALVSIRIHSYNLAVFCDPCAWICAGTFVFFAYHYLMKKIENGNSKKQL